MERLSPAATAHRSFASSLFGAARLVRPANLPSAGADVIAGAAVAGVFDPAAYLMLPWAAVLLYAGGVALNDFFDRAVDARERPERPIPSGAVAPGAALALGLVLLAAGVGAAFAYAPSTGFTAAALAQLIVVYDRWGKASPLWGPVAMGGCRALALLVGIAASPAGALYAAPWAVAPLVYVAGLTRLSRGEVAGGRRGPAVTALVGAAFAAGAVSAFGLLQGSRWFDGAPFVLLFGFMVAPPLARAARAPRPAMIAAAVTAGVLAITALDAAWVGFRFGPLWGAAVLTLWGVSLTLRKWFMVT